MENTVDIGKILKQPLTVMKKATVNSCTVNSSNVYNNTSGIDFYKVYSEYNFSLPAQRNKIKKCQISDTFKAYY